MASLANSVYKGSEVISGNCTSVKTANIKRVIMKTFAGKEIIILNLCRIFNVCDNREDQLLAI